MSPLNVLLSIPGVVISGSGMERLLGLEPAWDSLSLRPASLPHPPTPTPRHIVIITSKRKTT